MTIWSWVLEITLFCFSQVFIADILKIASPEIFIYNILICTKDIYESRTVIFSKFEVLFRLEYE